MVKRAVMGGEIGGGELKHNCMVINAGGLPNFDHVTTEVLSQL